MSLINVYMKELGGRKIPSKVITESTKPGDLEGPTKGTSPKSSDGNVKKDLKKPSEDHNNSSKMKDGKPVKESVSNFDKLFQAAINEDFGIDFGSEIDGAAPGAEGDDFDLKVAEGEEGEEEAGTLEDAFELLTKALGIVEKLKGESVVEGEESLEDAEGLEQENQDDDDLVNEEEVDSENGEGKGKVLMTHKSGTVKNATPVQGGSKASGEASGEEDGGKPKKVSDTEGHKLTKNSSMDVGGVRAGKDLFNN